MTHPPTQNIPIYLEIGKKRTIACAVDWPGWCRIGAGEDAALEVLLAYGSRYSKALGARTFGFIPPAAVSDFEVLARLKGGSAADFGVPGVIPPMDEDPLDDAGLERLQRIIEACWLELERTARLAEGKELRKGPRGGGRERDEILRHVIDANGAYLSSVGWKPATADQAGHALQADRDALAAASRGELPKFGPRGGKHWPPRYFARRVAWHILDHAWEIEDRILY